ncbi:MAG: CYTH domain-containing protein [Candidatus Dormibacteraeota bacterium]|nr:CYTH domain-containing protein [Candidatus Dormibacteraeota bacterium]
MATEREFKSDVAETFVLPDLDGVAGLRASDRGVRRLDAVYWDTDELRLMHSGFGLRHRTTDGGAVVWTLKGGTHREGDAVVRDEFEVPGTADVIPAELAARVAAVTAIADVHPVAHLHTARHVVDLDDGERRWAEVADDTVSVLRGDRLVHTFREVEVELTAAGEGTAQDARAAQVLAALREAGAGQPSSSSKYVRALRALGYDVGAAAAD